MDIWSFADAEALWLSLISKVKAFATEKQRVSIMKPRYFPLCKKGDKEKDVVSLLLLLPLHQEKERLSSSNSEERWP